MSTEKTLKQELKAARKKRFWDSVADSGFGQAIKGILLFAEGAALLICSLFSIYTGHYGNYPQWGKDALLISGAFVIVPAAILLSKFFRAIGKE